MMVDQTPQSGPEQKVDQKHLFGQAWMAGRKRLSALWQKDLQTDYSFLA